jgi:hypothetical protein
MTRKHYRALALEVRNIADPGARAVACEAVVRAVKRLGLDNALGGPLEELDVVLRVVR